LNFTAMRLHEPKCRRSKLLRVGARFHVRLNQKLVPVVLREFQDDGGFLCVNLDTGRKIRVKSPRRFREWMEGAIVSFRRPPRA
jgi:hypothetical protein